MKLRVIKVDQFTSVGIKDMPWEELLAIALGNKLNDIPGDSPEAARKIFGGAVQIIEVEETWRPIKGEVWYLRGDDGNAKIYKANYDSGD